jgi:hypothetical protein
MNLLELLVYIQENAKLGIELLIRNENSTDRNGDISEYTYFIHLYREWYENDNKKLDTIYKAYTNDLREDINHILDCDILWLK